MVRKRLTDWLVYVAVRVIVCIFQTLTMETCQQIARAVAYLANDLIRLRRRVVDENLSRVFPDWTAAHRQETARRMWEHLILMVCEIAHLSKRLHDTNWRQFITMSGKREMVSLLLDERPVVVVSGHFGNFELGCYIIGMFGFPVYAIARTLDNPYLDRFIRRYREAKGQFILPKDGSATLIATLLERGEKLALLGDQHAGPKGCWVEFLGQPASCHKAVALFTLTSGAPMLVISVRRDGAPLKYHIALEGAADPRSLSAEQTSVPGLTRWYNQCLEQAIRRSPEQYWWLHRRWRDAPPARRATRAA